MLADVFIKWILKHVFFHTKIGRLGSGESDFAAFVQYTGIPSVDMAFGKGNNTFDVAKALKSQP